MCKRGREVERKREWERESLSLGTVEYVAFRHACKLISAPVMLFLSLTLTQHVEHNKEPIVCLRPNAIDSSLVLAWKFHRIYLKLVFLISLYKKHLFLFYTHLLAHILLYLNLKNTWNKSDPKQVIFSIIVYRCSY